MFNKFKVIYKRFKLDKILKKNIQSIKIDKSTKLLEEFFIISKNEILKKSKVAISKKCLLNCNIIFEKDSGEISIGERCYIGGGTNLISINSIEIGDDVTISWGCTIYDHNSHSVNWYERKNDTLQSIEDINNGFDFIQNKNWNVVKSAPIKIKDKVWIGFDVVILKGVTIGEGAVIGARSVVTKDVLPYTVVAGNPAKVVKTLKKENEL